MFLDYLRVRQTFHETGTHGCQAKRAPNLNVLVCRSEDLAGVTSTVLPRPNHPRSKGGSSASCHRAGKGQWELGDIPCQFSQLSYCSAFSWLQSHKFPDLLLPGKMNRKKTSFKSILILQQHSGVKPSRDSLSNALQFDPDNSNDL